MNIINPTEAVAVRSCKAYTIQEIKTALQKEMQELGIVPTEWKGKKVVIKPNLVMKKGTSHLATTHPVLLEALLSLLQEYGIDACIAESPGGIYSENRLRGIYNGCGITEVAERMHTTLNYDTTFEEIAAPDGFSCKMFHFITPIANADVVINLCRLKTHALTRMSGAVKNLFGIIPGTEKFEMHARFSESKDFASMLNDIAATLHKSKTIITILDAIVGMEGNGPTAGTPRTIGCLLMGRNAFSVDVAASSLIGFDGTVEMIELAKERGYCPEKAKEVSIIGDSLANFSVSDYKLPDSRGDLNFLKVMPNLFGGKFNQWIQPKARIQANCIGCGDCVRSCPKHTIVFVSHNGKRKAFIHQNECIHCYCCQELCPHDAVKIKKNPILALIR